MNKLKKSIETIIRLVLAVFTLFTSFGFSTNVYADNNKGDIRNAEQSVGSVSSQGGVKLEKTISKTSTDGEFYIKKYGSEQYLNPVKKRDGSNNEDWFYCCELGTQNETGIYKLETPIDNRYTRIQNAGLYDRAGLTSNQFFNWSTNYPGANKTDENRTWFFRRR